MGLLDNLLSKVDVIVSDFNFNSKSKKPCTEEEKKKMLDILKGYEVLDKQEIESRPVDFGSVLRIGDEMKQILQKTKVNPNCYLEDIPILPIEKGTIERNVECYRDSDCKEDLMCIGYVKNLSPGKCLDPLHDVVDTGALVTFGNECETPYDCSIGSQCSTHETTFGSKKKCIAFNFPLTDKQEKYVEKIILYPIL